VAVCYGDKMSKEIQLTRGQIAIVDDEDYEYINQWKWYAHFDGTNYYAQRMERGIWPIKKRKQKGIHMHRMISKTPEGMITDHLNHNTLDNRKNNLRNVTSLENNRNIKKRKDNTTGATGVHIKTFASGNKKYAVSVSGKHIGYYKDLETAKKAYDEAILARDDDARYAAHVAGEAFGE
jgi:hypothetical protein